MGSIIFNIDADELDTRFLKSIKAYFKHQRIKILVTSDEMNSDEEKLILARIEANKVSDYTFDIPSADFEALAAQFDADENFDILGEIKKFKIQS